MDGYFEFLPVVDIDPENNFLYVGNSSSLQKFDSESGKFLGAIGYSSANGTCVEGAQTQWCAGGTYISKKGDGMFYIINSVSIVDSIIYVGDSARIQRIKETP